VNDEMYTHILLLEIHSLLKIFYLEE